MAGALAMHMAAGFCSGDPLAFTRRRGNAPIQRHRQFQRQPRAIQRVAQEKALVINVRLISANANDHLYPGVAQDFKTTARNAIIRIRDGGNHPRDARRDQGSGAGRCLPVMGARFQRDIGCGPARRRACLR